MTDTRPGRPTGSRNVKPTQEELRQYWRQLKAAADAGNVSAQRACIELADGSPSARAMAAQASVIAQYIPPRYWDKFPEELVELVVMFRRKIDHLDDLKEVQS